MRNLGLFFIVGSFLPWAAIVLIVPLLAVSSAQKALLISVLAIVAEVLFWLGLLLVGKEAAKSYRRYFSLGYLWKQLQRLWRSK